MYTIVAASPTTSILIILQLGGVITDDRECLKLGAYVTDIWQKSMKTTSLGLRESEKCTEFANFVSIYLTFTRYK